MTAFRLLTGIFLVTAFFLAGCSTGSQNPTIPSPDESKLPTNSINSLDLTGGSVESNHVPWGFWTIAFDQETHSVTVTPDRVALKHFDVTESLLPPNCNDCVEFKVNSYDPLSKILDVDVTLKNPTKLEGRDVRGIFYSDDLGRTMVVADDWTGLWDIPGGEDINPFMAFAKSVPSRVFAASEKHAENYLIRMTHWGAIHYAVDASWPENCEEPYEISGFTQEKIHADIGASGAVSVVIFDWLEDTDEVTISVPEITGTEFVELSHIVDYTWAAEIINNTGASLGNYEALIAASSEGDGTLALYDKVTIVVSESHPELNIIKLTPPWLNFTPRGIDIEGDYLYTAGSHNGIHVWNISDPSNPEWITKIDHKLQAYRMYVQNGLAYASGWTGVEIYDVDPPEDINHIYSLGPFSPYMDIRDGYLYEAGLKIWDIDPYETAHIVQTVDLDKNNGDTVRGMAAAEETVCIYFNNGAMETSGTRIVNIDPPETAWLAASSDYSVSTDSIDAEDGVGCRTTSDWFGKSYFSVFNAVTGKYIKSIDGVGPIIEIIDGYGYAGGGYPDSFIIDLSVPEEASVVNTLGYSSLFSVASGGDNIIAAGGGEGLKIFSYFPPADPVLLKEIPSPRTRWLAAGDDIVITGEDYTCAIVDMSIPSEIEFVSSIKPEEHLRIESAAIDGSYVYIAAGDLYIVDISIPDQPVIIFSVETLGDRDAIAVDDGYACIAGYQHGFEIIDVEPPESAHSVGSLDGEIRSSDVEVKDGFAYVLGRYYSGTEELFIIDITTPESPQIIKTIGNQPGDPEYDFECIDIDGDYVYIALDAPGSEGAVRIIDISTPEDAFICQTIEFDQSIELLCVSNDYLFIKWDDPVLEQGIKIIDISSMENPVEVGFIQTEENLYEIAVEAPYFYVAGMTGLDIFQLW